MNDVEMLEEKKTYYSITSFLSIDYMNINGSTHLN